MNQNLKDEEKNHKELIIGIFDLYGNYRFRIEDITKIMNGESIYDILSNKIYKILVIAEKYKVDFNENYEEDIEKIIPTEENIKKSLIENKTEIIKILEKYKNELLDNEDATGVLEDIDELINIIKKIEEILNKYEGIEIRLRNNKRNDEFNNIMRKIDGIVNKNNKNIYIGKFNIC